MFLVGETFKKTLLLGLFNIPMQIMPFGAYLCIQMTEKISGHQDTAEAGDVQKCTVLNTFIKKENSEK